MLAHTVARRFQGKVEVAIENFGDSELAQRFGIERYPAVFVGEVLIAKPKDFGFFGEGGSQGAGRYTPWRDTENQARFEADLERIVERALAGQLTASEGVRPDPVQDVTELPDFTLKDLEGLEVSRSTLLGRPTVVDFWATWCPPCVRSLPKLNELQRTYAKDLNVVGVVIESPEEEIRRFVDAAELVFPTVIGDADLARSFGDIPAVPTLFVFDAEGKMLEVIYGAPPDLHERIEALVEKALGRGEKGR